MCQNCTVFWECWTMSRSLFLTSLNRRGLYGNCCRRAFNGLGESTRKGVFLLLLFSDEAGVEFPSCPVPLQSRPAYQGVSWCVVVLWHGSSTPSAEGWWLASHFLFFKVHDVDRAALCAGRKGITGVYLGLWEVLTSYWVSLPSPLRLTTDPCCANEGFGWAVATKTKGHEDEGFRWAVATNTKVPHAPYAVQLQGDLHGG